MLDNNKKLRYEIYNETNETNWWKVNKTYTGINYI